MVGLVGRREEMVGLVGRREEMVGLVGRREEFVDLVDSIVKKIGWMADLVFLICPTDH